MIVISWWWFSHSIMSNSCDPMDCSQPGSSIHGIFQARILEWVATSFSRVSSQPRDRTLISCIAGGFLTDWTTREETLAFLSHPKLMEKDSQAMSSPGVPMYNKVSASLGRNWTVVTGVQDQLPICPFTEVYQWLKISARATGIHHGETRTQ